MEIQVFVSCPSDVNKEKLKVKTICDRVNSNLLQIGCDVYLIYRDFKEIIGEIGKRPQQIINERINGYDIYLGILFMRFGTPTGAFNNFQEPFQSGTEEEYEIACEKRSLGKQPESIYLFFKNQKGCKTTSENEQARKVLAFKERVGSNNWINSFSTTRDFENMVSDLLTREAAKVCMSRKIHAKLDLVHQNTKEIILLEHFVKQLPELAYYIPRSIKIFKDNDSVRSFLFEGNTNNLFLKDAIVEERKIVLLGNAGTGKSVELQQTAKYFLNEETPFISIYKRFNTYVDESIDDFLPGGWKNIDPELLVILLDGLDEVQPQHFNIAIRKLTDFTDRHSNLRIVVSCRTNFYELPGETFSGTLTGFKVYILNDFLIPEVKEYLNNEVKISGDKFILDAYNNSFFDLIPKPFFLNILIKHFKDNDSLRTSRDSIIENFILSRIDFDKEHFKASIDNVSTKENILSLLEKVAFIMELMGKNIFDDKELASIINQDELNQIKHFSAFSKNLTTNCWMFEHNNIQEFLAARVLSKQPLDKILKIISVSSAGKQKVKPTWVNTISFFTSINNSKKSKEVLDWIISNDVEVIIRFEPDRVTPDRRIQIFKEIFEFYSDRQIWLSSNKFSDTDLARFGNFEKVIEYLLGMLQNREIPRIIQLNAIKVLDKFKMSDFNKYAIPVKETLKNLLENVGLSDYDIYSILSALANLNFTDRETIDFVISKFRKHKNQYIRAGIYKLLLYSYVLNDYVDILIEGLDLNKIEDPIDDRKSVNLMDESFHLTHALKKINGSGSLKKIVTLFTDKKTRSTYLSDYKEIITSLIENSIQVYEKDKEIYTYIKNFFLVSLHSYPNNLPQLIKPFFDATHTDLEIFLFIWENKDISKYEKTELTEIILSKDIAQSFLEMYKKRGFNNDDTSFMHEILFKRERTNPEFIAYREELEVVAKEMFGFILEVPKYPDWNKINKERNQIAFDILFKPETLLQEVEKIFARTGKEILRQEDLYDFRSSQFDQPEDVFVSSALDLLREFTYGNISVTIQMISEFIADKVRFGPYQTNQIYEFLHTSNNNSLYVSEPQLKFINDWCQTNGSDIKILWYFIQKFKIRLSEEKILNLTVYYDFNSEVKLEEPGTIEQLIDFIDKKKLTLRVIENLNTGILDSFSWFSNVGYAIRNNIRETYTSILDYLKKVKHNEYKFSDVLQFWFSKTKEVATLQVFIETVYSDILRWKAISLLYSAEISRDFLIDYMKRFMNNRDNSIDYRFMAANYLMEMSNVDGLIFCAKYILDKKDPLFRYHDNLSKMAAFTNSEGLPLLMKLLHLSKQEEFKKDTFNSLETIIIDTLFNMGISSDENLIAVRSTINNFIASYGEELENLNFLQITLQRMEDQLNMKKSQNITILEALGQWNNYIQN